MPIYEYQCKGCHHTCDVIQKVSDPELNICPQCSEALLVRLMSAPGFQLKGTGWYETDFKSPKPTNVSTPASSTTDTASSSAASTACKASSDKTSS